MERESGQMHKCNAVRRRYASRLSRKQHELVDGADARAVQMWHNTKPCIDFHLTPETKNCVSSRL